MWGWWLAKALLVELFKRTSLLTKGGPHGHLQQYKQNGKQQQQKPVMHKKLSVWAKSGQ